MIYTPSRIESFSGAYEFLSNFYEKTLEYDNRYWPTLEHAYQAMKTLDPDEREAIRASRSPALAKRLGRRLKMRDDWDDIKIGLMHELLRVKFRDVQLREQLIATGDAELVEGNHWGDTFWGVCKGHGTNWLGRLLMAVRREIKHERGLV